MPEPISRRDYFIGCALTATIIRTETLEGADLLKIVDDAYSLGLGMDETCRQKDIEKHDSCRKVN